MRLKAKEAPSSSASREPEEAPSTGATLDPEEEEEATVPFPAEIDSDDDPAVMPVYTPGMFSAVESTSDWSTGLTTAPTSVPLARLQEQKQVRVRAFLAELQRTPGMGSNNKAQYPAAPLIGLTWVAAQVSGGLADVPQEAGPPPQHAEGFQAWF